MYAPDCQAFSRASQKAPSAKRCIKTEKGMVLLPYSLAGQKAPSTKRCIKTCRGCLRWRRRASRQKAPSAKRRIKTLQQGSFFFLPVGACQKAPSAIRCIKTRLVLMVEIFILLVKKHRVPKGALRHAPTGASAHNPPASESTERHKAY